jgi:hypothetical protein
MGGANHRVFAECRSPRLQEGWCADRVGGSCLSSSFFGQSQRKKKQERKIGGADRDRTDDLLIANEALSQLSYSPTEGARIVAPGPVGPARVGSGIARDRDDDLPTVTCVAMLPEVDALPRAELELT